MEIDIQPCSENNIHSWEILLSHKMCKDLEIIEGQRLQFDLEDTPILLKVRIHETGGRGLVNQSIFELLNKSVIQVSIPEVTLGCDPEFFIRHKRGTVMCAAGILRPENQVGSDGFVGELRPNHGVNEDQVTENLRHLIKSIPNEIHSPTKTELNFEAHSYLRSICAGFHIHLGLPTELLNAPAEINQSSLKYIGRCLDWYVLGLLGTFEPNSPRRTGKLQFGKPGDCRLSDITLEYRTAGGFFLRTPDLARALLGTSLLVGKTLVERIRGASKDFADMGKLREEDFQKMLPTPSLTHIWETLTTQDRRRGVDVVSEILSTLQTLPDYEQHKTSLIKLMQDFTNTDIRNPNLLTHWGN